MIWIVVVIFVLDWVHHDCLLVDCEDRIGRDSHPRFYWKLDNKDD